MPQLSIGELIVDVIYKDIKHLHLSVYPPAGKVRISAPRRMSLDTIRAYTISKLGWIRIQQRALKNQKRESAREYISRESHFFLGKRYLLKVTEGDAPNKIVKKHDIIELRIRPYLDTEKRREIFDEWYRLKLKEIAPVLVAHYEKEMRLNVAHLGIKKMKTKWGSCNSREKRIWLNLELAKKPKECIEYIVVHEMTHIIERHHNEKFFALMDRYLPRWKYYKDMLNQIPLRQENWSY